MNLFASVILVTAIATSVTATNWKLYGSTEVVSNTGDPLKIYRLLHGRSQVSALVSDELILGSSSHMTISALISFRSRLDMFPEYGWTFGIIDSTLWDGHLGGSGSQAGFVGMSGMFFGITSYSSGLSSSAIIQTPGSTFSTGLPTAYWHSNAGTMEQFKIDMASGPAVDMYWGTDHRYQIGDLSPYNPNPFPPRFRFVITAASGSSDAYLDIAEPTILTDLVSSFWCPPGSQTWANGTGCSPCSNVTGSPGGYGAFCFCDPHCTTCPSNAVCTQCQSGWSLPHFPICSSCPRGEFGNGSFCQPCSLVNGCNDCDHVTGACTSCSAGKYRSGLSCADCPLKTYSTGGSATSCQQCGVSCSDCDATDGSCILCPPRSGISGTGCVTCSATQFSDGTGPCQSCDLHDGCTACDNTNGMCTSCPSPKGRWGSGCIDCTNLEFLSNGFCMPCDVSWDCGACDVNSGNCTKCPDGLTAVDNKCENRTTEPIQSPASVTIAPLFLLIISFFLLF